LLPLTLPAEWLSSEQFLHVIEDENVRNWVRSQSSLTVKIKELGIAFSVEVIRQSEQALAERYRSKLAVDDDSALFREVLLKQGGSPLVYAQTIMPNSTVTGTERILAELGNQSLGQVLFQSPQAVRSIIEFAEVLPNSPLGLYIQDNLGQAMKTPCYIRRSVFHLNHKPLLVCECFLPELFN
jgi:chorismate--pyruvate lyase